MRNNPKSTGFTLVGGDHLTRTAGKFVYTRPGLGGVKLSAVKYPGRTLLVVNAIQGRYPYQTVDARFHPFLPDDGKLISDFGY
jgi:hypothetical protein